MLKKLLYGNQKPKADRKQLNRYRDLIRREAEIGGRLFGEIPKDRRREFFCLDKNTWIWHEEWTDVSGQHQSRTTRYDVRPDVILKAQDGASYQAVTNDEARNFLAAAKTYHEAVDRELYSQNN